VLKVLHVALFNQSVYHSVYLVTSVLVVLQSVEIYQALVNTFYNCI